MRIDPKVEQPTRTMLGHAIRGELDELATTIRGLGNGRRFAECIGLSVAIAGYIAVDVLGPNWPGEAGLRRMAEHAANSEIDFQLDEVQVYDYLNKSAVGFQPLDRVFATTDEMTSLPIVMTASLMLAFCPREQEVWDYLTDIEEALELSDSVKPSALPAMIIRAHRIEKAERG